MRKFTLPLIAILAATPALAGDMTPAVTGGHIYTADEPFVSPTEQARRNAAHERQTYDLIIANGGCNSNFNTVEYTTYCHAGTFGAPQMGSGE